MSLCKDNVPFSKILRWGVLKIFIFFKLIKQCQIILKFYFYNKIRFNLECSRNHLESICDSYRNQIRRSNLFFSMFNGKITSKLSKISLAILNYKCSPIMILSAIIVVLYLKTNFSKDFNQMNYWLMALHQFY